MGDFSKGGVHKTDGFYGFWKMFYCFWKLSTRVVDFGKYAIQRVSVSEKNRRKKILNKTEFSLYRVQTYFLDEIVMSTVTERMKGMKRLNMRW